MTFGTNRGKALRLASTIVLAYAVGCIGTPHAQEKAPAQAGADKIVVCDDLIALRRLMSDAADQASARGHLSEHAACREVAASDLGEVERRTMVGGVPYECRKQPAGACAWVLP